MSEFTPHNPEPQTQNTPLDYFSPYTSEKRQLPQLNSAGKQLNVQFTSLDFSKSPSPIDRARETNTMATVFEDSGKINAYALGALSQDNQRKILKITDMENLDSLNAQGAVRALLLHLISTGTVSEIIIPRERSGHAEKMMQQLMERSASGEIPFEIVTPREELGSYIIRGK